MVEPIRQSALSYQSEHSFGGLFVIGKSNAIDKNIPHLPVLSPIESGDGTYNSKYVKTRQTENIVQIDNINLAFDKGDIVECDPRFHIARSVLSSKANTNTLLVTERCENRCTFCSQPPNQKDDSHLYTRAALSLINYNTQDIVGITGGEPTYNRNAFLTLLNTLAEFSCPTPLHILSNGRNFADKDFASRVVSAAAGREILWGIPLYGHKASLHDAQVQSEGAFSSTLQGLLNLSEFCQAIELRVVSTQENIEYLSYIVNFLAINAPFINVISIMNLEPKGWGRKNYSSLYVPVKKQNKSLIRAVEMARNYGLALRLFNYPLCLLDDELRSFAVKSISDWKNYFPEECNKCTMKSSCGGFFTSAAGQFIEPVEAIQ